MQKPWHALCGVKCQQAFNQNIIQRDSLWCQDYTINVLEQLVKPFWEQLLIKTKLQGNYDWTASVEHALK